MDQFQSQNQSQPQRPQEPQYPRQDLASQVHKEHASRTKLIVVMVLVLLLLVAGGMYAWVVLFEEGAPTVGETDQPVQGTQDGELLNQRPVYDPYPGDRDRDGIQDNEEEALGTSTRDYDSDGDGLSDKTERDVWKTDPTNNDTDGDGFSDGIEILNGYNPNGEGDLTSPSES